MYNEAKIASWNAARRTVFRNDHTLMKLFETDARAFRLVSQYVNPYQAAFEAIRNDPTDPDATERLYDIALADPVSARTALEDLTKNEPLRSRFCRAATLPDVEELILRNMTPPGSPVAPKTLGELRQLMTKAASEWRPMRAIGAGYNFTNIDDTEGDRILMSEHLRNVLTIDRSVLKSTTGDALLQFEAGATVEELTEYLSRHQPAWSLLNQPGYEKLTLIGVASCGGHGSGLRLAPICDAIRSLRLLTIDANHDIRLRQIEPANGITDPLLFAAKEPTIELIQDDTIFCAAKVSMGTFGIIYSAIIEVQPAFYLREDRVMSQWNEVKTQLPAMLADADIHSIHVWLNPYRVKDQQWCVTSEYRLSAGPPHGERGRGIRFGGFQAIIDVMLWVVRTFPLSTPGLVNASIKATTATDVVMPSWEALNFGPPNRLRSLGIDYGVDVRNTVQAADALSEALQARGANQRSFVLSPLGIRFCRASEALMTPSYGRDTCMIELPLLDGLPRRDEFVSVYERALAPFDARPHWGQLNTLDAESTRRLYPRFNDFRHVFELFNPSGLFDNTFTRKIGLSGRT